jgi:peptide/nickel transport system ATP-binding protein
MTFDGKNLLTLGESGMRELRGKRIAMIMQDPKYSLNPVMTVGKQLIEAFRTADRKLGKKEAKNKALAALTDVRIYDPERVFAAWPHELSGGMGQRVMIAMMVALGPDLLIADEPTSALDVTVQMQVLSVLDDLVAKSDMGLMFISHDLELVSAFCDRVVVMYSGQIMEECAADKLREARHPYTRGLLDAMPNIREKRPMLPVLERDPLWMEACE